ncbi:MAG TPA: GspE/PulE family protein [Acidimicrobiia bacterium]|nr:GspE/PulE family protein [Acidimicrobiia bacterium]
MRPTRTRKAAMQEFEAVMAARFTPPSDDANVDEDVRPAPDKTPLGQLLIGQGRLTEEQLAEALLAKASNGIRFGEALVQTGAISPLDLAQALGAQLGFDVVDLAHEEVDSDVAGRLPEDLARRLCAIPVRMHGERVLVATADPAVDGLRQDLIDALEAPVRLLIAPSDQIQRAIDQTYRSQAEITDALRDFEERAKAQQRTVSTFDLAAALEADEDAPVVRVVNLILEQGARDRASDIHIEPQPDRVRIRLRTDGAMTEMMSLPASMATSLVSRIKVLSDMNIVERRKPQDGQMNFTIDGRELDIRVATSLTVHGEMCVMRLLDKSRALKQLSELGMPADTLERYRSLIRSPYGMVICAGPTGSGKTTTLYATLAEVNDDAIKVTTIEDPVEYVIPSINQIQINELAGVTFAGGLRAILRQDPDSILVGEIRDVETARIAVQAALTGHFVMSSLHATDASAALHRFLEMGIEPFVLTSSLLGVVGQRLVRRNCRHCTERYEPSAEELSFFGDYASYDASDVVHRRGAGCNFCSHTGYFERVGVYEVLKVTEEMRELVAGGAQHHDIRALAVEQGMRSLRDQAARLVADGTTTIAEVLRTVYVL